VSTGLPRAGSREEISFSSERLQRLLDAFDTEVRRGAIPGAIVFVARHGKVGALAAIGYRDRGATAPIVKPLASARIECLRARDADDEAGAA
jgi:hypothetical protein